MKINNASFEFIENNKRVQPKGIEAKQTPTHKTGIKVYNMCIGWFLALLGVAVLIKDADNKIWYVNKNSLRGWGKSNSGEEPFKLSNLDQLLNNIKKPPLAYPAARIAKELWLRDQLLSDETVEKVNHASDYLQKEGFDLEGIEADGNCLFSAYSKGHQYLNQKIPILDFQKNKIEYLRDILSKTYGDADRAEEIKRDREHVSANEAERLSITLDRPIRFITPIEGGDISDMLARKDQVTQNWDSLENKPKTGDYIIIVDLGGHFITAKPTSLS